jgi:Peptidase A4 family
MRAGDFPAPLLQSADDLRPFPEAFCAAIPHLSTGRFAGLRGHRAEGSKACERAPAGGGVGPLVRTAGAGLAALVASACLVATAAHAAGPARGVAAVAAPRGGAAATLAGATLAVQPAVSSNWAGYVVTGPGSTATTASPAMTYTDVTGQWVEPKAVCTGVATSVALWVGLGGYSTDSQALEQTGTSADCGANGTPSYYAWYELVPANSVTIKLKIFPGNVIASSVVVSGNSILVQVTNRTRGTRFTRRLTTDAPDLTSAEWIAEAPAECSSDTNCRQVALTNFGAVTFTRTYAVGNDVDGTITGPGWSATPIELVPHAQRFYGAADQSSGGAAGAGAMPLALAADGSGFAVDWQANASSMAPTGASPAPATAPATGMATGTMATGT